LQITVVVREWSFLHLSCNPRVVWGLVSVKRGQSSDHKLFLNRPIQFYLNNVTNLRQLISKGRTSCLQHGDRIVTIAYSDVTSPYLLHLVLIVLSSPTAQLAFRQQSRLCLDELPSSKTSCISWYSGRRPRSARGFRRRCQPSTWLFVRTVRPTDTDVDECLRRVRQTRAVDVFEEGSQSVVGESGELTRPAYGQPSRPAMTYARPAGNNASYNKRVTFVVWVVEQWSQ